MINRSLTTRPLLTATVSVLLCLFLLLWAFFEIISFYSSPEGDLFLVTLVLTIATVTAVALVVSVVRRNDRLQRELEAATARRVGVEELTLAAAGLAHETKNPLGIIRGLAQQIADDGTNPAEARQKARLIMEGADVTSARLGDFINYARVRDPEFDALEALPHLTETCDLIRADFETNGIAFDTDIADVRIRADAEMLSQVLLNLLTNSLKATPCGGRVRVALQRERGRYARLTVTDTGRGIPREALPYVFAPYVRKAREGHGLGLAIVKRLVERCGWTIALDSTEDVGTCVHIGHIEVCP